MKHVGYRFAPPNPQSDTVFPDSQFANIITLVAGGKQHNITTGSIFKNRLYNNEPVHTDRM